MQTGFILIFLDVLFETVGIIYLQNLLLKYYSPRKYGLYDSAHVFVSAVIVHSYYYYGLYHNIITWLLMDNFVIHLENQNINSVKRSDVT